MRQYRKCEMCKLTQRQLNKSVDLYEELVKRAKFVSQDDWTESMTTLKQLKKMVRIHE